ncbi:DDE transposase family protein [Kyrpidia spormannii]|uniref:DDE transposase family protein n=1 Tax=Kyrpidia spormannii TaxID=2055160 RepID=A0A2K8N3A3_9BACL|nr:tetratricopeptide repeat protein [Kyrpidia spormannii]ATY83978.1 DDE transposase family protein [Kyrpidia spormannii]
MAKQGGTSGKPKGHKVALVRMDATFFFERAVRSLDRHDLPRALKYFRKVVEYEPANPVNHCNLAGVLSELGDYQASNEVLERVLLELDPKMYECYFYMANNFANLGLYDLAQEYASRYLEVDPEGEFAEEAEEMLDILVTEFGTRMVRRRRDGRIRLRGDEDVARRFLEDGRFLDAAAYLEAKVQESSDATVDRNNLSLAYYYLGDVEKAIETAKGVLELQPGNLHAVCNLAIFYRSAGKEEQTQALLDQLRRLRPIQPELAYKLGTTMGILQEHRTAYDIFNHLVRFLPRPEAPVVHALAAAAANLGRLRKAARLWEEVHVLDPSSGIGRYYEEVVREAISRGLEVLPVSYQYVLPYADTTRLNGPGSEDPGSKLGRELWPPESVVRSSLMWVLRHGDPVTKKQVIPLVVSFGGEDVERALRFLLLDDDEYLPVKQAALKGMFELQPEEIVEIGLPSRILPVDFRPESARSLAGRPEWQRIVQLAVQELQGRGETTLAKVAMEIWSEFTQLIHLQAPRVRKPELWAGALECAARHRCHLPFSRKEVAERYKVSQQGLGDRLWLIIETCMLTD